MVRLAAFITLLFIFAGGIWAQSGQVSVGVSVTDRDRASFYLAISNYYHVPEPQVVAVRDRHRLHDEELPVIYFLASRARMEPSAIIDLRIGGLSWLDIAFRCGLTPEVFFVPVKVKKIGPPYGNAYGYYKKYSPAKEWTKIILTDREVVDLVNLRFISEYHGLPPDEIMKSRGQGKIFVTIHGEIEKGKGKNKDKGKEKKEKK